MTLPGESHTALQPLPASLVLAILIAPDLQVTT